MNRAQVKRVLSKRRGGSRMPLKRFSRRALVLRLGSEGLETLEASHLNFDQGADVAEFQGTVGIGAVWGAIESCSIDGPPLLVVGDSFTGKARVLSDEYYDVVLMERKGRRWARVSGDGDEG